MMKRTESINIMAKSPLKKSIIAIVSIALFADYFLLTVVIPIVPSFFQPTHSSFMIALLFAAKPTTQLLANFILGPCVDFKGPKAILMPCTAILAISTLVFGIGLEYVKNVYVAYWVLLAARCVQGIASSGIMTAGMAAIASCHHTSLHGSAMGSAMAGVAAGVVSGPPIGGIMSTYAGNASPFLLVSGLLLINFASQTWYFYSKQGFSHDLPLLSETVMYSDMGSEAGDTEVDTRKRGCCNTILPLFGQTHIMAVASCNFFGNFCVGMMEVLTPLYLESHFKLSQLYQGLIFGALSLAFLLAAPVAGIMSDKFAKWKVLMVGPFLAGVGLILFYWSEKLPVMIVALVTTGVGVAFIDSPSLPLMSTIATWKNLDQIGSVYALQDICVCLGFTAGPLLATSVENLLGFHKTCLVIGLILLAYIPFLLHLRTVPTTTTY